MLSDCPKSAPANRGLVLVDADTPARRQLAQQLAAHGYSVMPTAEPQEAVAVVKMGEAAFVVTELRWDHHLGLPGLDLLAAVAGPSGHPRSVVVTDWGTCAATAEAMRLGAADVIVRPCALEEVVDALEGRLEARRRAAFAKEAWAPPTLEQVEREYMDRILVKSGGSIAKAATFLGLHRRTLQRKMEKKPRAVSMTRPTKS